MSDRAFAALGVMAGMLVIAYGVRLWQLAGQRVARAIRVQGRVVSAREEDDDGGRVWFPTIAFEVNGTVHTIVGSGESSEPTIGNQVSLHYPADDPSAAWTKGSVKPWFLALLTILAGAAIAGGFSVWLLEA